MSDILLALFALVVSVLCLAAGFYQIHAGHLANAFGLLVMGLAVAAGAFEMARKHIDR